MALHSMVGGALFAVLTQVLTFASADLGNGSSGQQADVFAVVRLGVVVTVVVTALADKVGRRRIAVWSFAAAALLTVASAAVPTLAALTVVQLLARNLAIAGLLCVDTIVIEELPAGSRAMASGLGAMAFGLFWLIWILVETVRLGLGGLGLSVFTESTPPPQAEIGGLANAIVGSLIMVSLATLLGTPIGVMAGIYLAEYGKRGWLGAVTGFINDILLSAPSIVIGLFIYSAVVAKVKTFSGFAGILALALIVIPVVIRTTENMLTLIPNALREAAYALGAPKWKVIISITLKAARAGVITGVLLAVARIAGETAPLLFTSLGNTNWSTDLTQPMASLPIAIYRYAGSPYPEWVSLAWTGAMLITVGVLALNILSRFSHAAVSGKQGG